jgi:outer membrane protein assembly factor BamB
MKIQRFAKLAVLLGIPIIFIACDNYNSQFVNKEKIKSPPENISKGDLNAGSKYAASAWPAPHRDVRNSDYLPFYTSADVRFAWIELDHAGFFIGPTIGPEGNVYLPTGYGAGYSNLFCFDRYGNKLWESDKLISGSELEGVDYGCEINAPIIDLDGNVYQCDCDQVWSFTNTGALRWVSSLREFDIQGMFISPFFTREGYIGGCTTDGFVALFDMQTGRLVFDKLKLPGTKGPKSLKMIDQLWETQMCLEIRQLAWDAVFGCNMQCSNTPALDPEKGRIFIVANGFSEDEGMIHRVDITPEGLKLVFSISTGTGGSGTSPDLTFDGKIVIFTDGTGFFTGVDAETGEIRWRKDTKSVTGVSSTTTPGGMAINYSYNYLTAYNAYTGELLWKANMDSLVADKDLKGLIARRSTPSAVVASSVMATPDKLWMIVLSCAKMALTEKQKERNTSGVFPIKGMPKDSVRIPQRYYLCSFDYKGNLLSKTPAPGDGAMITAGIDGRLYVTGLSAYSDVVYHQTPRIFRTTPRPTTGFWGYEPASFKMHAAEALLFLASYFDEETSFENFRHLTDDQRLSIVMEQLKGIKLALQQASARNELSEAQLKELILHLDKISGFITNGEKNSVHSEILACYQSCKN